MIKNEIIKYLVKEAGKAVAEFWIYHDAVEYIEKFGGELYKIVTTVKEYKSIGGGVWA